MNPSCARFAQCFGLAVVVALLFAGTAHADSARFQQFEYDAAGNIVSVNSTIQTGLPSIDTISPEQVRIGGLVRVVFTGANLLGVEVTSASAQLTIENLQSESAAGRFDLIIAPGIPLGPYDLNFATSFGTATAQIEIIAGDVPTLSVIPGQLAVVVGGAAIAITAQLDTADIFDQTFEVTIEDTAIATLQGSTLAISQGVVSATGSVLLTGVGLGSTNLILQSPSFPLVSVPVYVAEPFDGATEIVSAVVSVTLSIENPVSGSRVAVSDPVGVTLSIDEPAASISAGVSALVGVVVGAGFVAVTPSSVGVGVTTEVIISGVNLDQVETIRLVPDQPAITFSLPVSSVDGSSLAVDVNVAAGATPGLYSLFADGSYGSILIPKIFEVVP